MKIKLCFFVLALFISCNIYGQRVTIPDLNDAKDSLQWTLINRKMNVTDGVVSLLKSPGNGLLWLDSVQFSNGRIICDIRGMDDPGKSFVGIAFHGLNDSTYDAIYFRPFNFRNPDRKGHSVQYISLPVYDWFSLREKSPGRYENSIQPAPDPDEWFHVEIEIESPTLKVYVNSNTKPSLIINSLTSSKSGKVAFWVGNSSEGMFKNFKIIEKGPK